MPRRLATLASRAQRTVTDYVTDVLVRQGVKNVFGGHGGAVIPLVGSIATRSDLNWVYMRNEQAASLAAAADAKLTGRLGVCVATSGPGSSHLTTGLIDALQDRCPVLALTGTKATSAVDLSEFQMIHQEQLFRAAGLPFSNVVMSEAAIPAMLRNAIAIALREKTAVHLALPVDIQSRLIAPPRGGSHGAAEISQIEYQASEARLMTAANAMRDPQMRVVIALGHRAATELDHEGHDSRHANPYVRLAETLNAPIVTQLDAKGCVDESHPLSYGVIGVFGNPGLDAARTLVTSADLVLLFGVDRQAVDLIADAAFNQVRRVVEFEPDAGSAAYHRWYECEAVVIGKLGANARRLEAAVANLRASAEAAESYRQLESARPINSFHSHWTWLLTAGWREAGANSLIEAPSTERRPSRFQIEHEEPAGFCHPARVLQALSALLKPDDVVCVDTGDITLWASLCLCLSGEQRVLSSQGMGTMGYALPAAIAAALQRPHRNVVAIAGDGGVQMTIGELATAKQHGANLTLIIFNNNLLGRVHFGFDAVSGDAIESPDYVALARAYGGDGVHVSSAEQVDGALRRALEHAGIFLIEVATDPALKAEYARMRDDSQFATQLRDELGDLLPAEMRPSDVRTLVAFNTHHDGMLSADELAAARRVLGSMKAAGGGGDDKGEALLRTLRTGQLFKNPVLTSVKQAFAPLEPSPFRFAPEPSKQGDDYGTAIHAIGSVADVLNSFVPEPLRVAKFSARPYKAGFEVGAIDAIAGLGEMAVRDGTVYVRETDERHAHFFETRSAREFITSAAVLVPADAVPDVRVSFNGKQIPEGVPFVRVVNDLCVALKSPCVFFGEIDWHRCDVTSISRAPVDGLSVQEHIADYYWKPGTVLHNNRTFLVGAIARDEAPRDELCREIFTRIFYDMSKPPARDEPAEAHEERRVAQEIASIVGAGQVYCHAHLITIDAAGKLGDVWHLNPNSVVASFTNLEVYKMRSITVVGPEDAVNTVT